MDAVTNDAPSPSHAAVPDLDPAQREAVERAPGSSFAVIGAPGTGKTVTLLELVAHRVAEHGVAPERVLVLTPTRQSATRLRDRIALRLGIPSNGPLARTANSAAFEIVRRSTAAAAAARGDSVRPVALLTGAEQDHIVAEILQGEIDDTETGEALSRWPDTLPPEVRRLREFRTELRELMMRATENGISADALGRLGVQHGVPEWIAASGFIRDYAGVLDAFPSASLDSAELLAEARRALRSGDVESRFDLVAVDDFHDLSIGALTLVREFARQGADVVAFGDPDAATTGFRGSDVRALGRLAQVLGVPTGAPVVLGTSYRQQGPLREFTQRVTERIGAAAAGRQRATADAGTSAAGVAAGRVLTIRAETRAGEVATVARLLRERFLLHGTDWSQMIVVVRSGALVPAMARGLGLAEVPTRTLSAVQALRDDYAARHLAEGVALAVGRQEPTPEVLSSVILGPLGGVDAVGLRRLRLALRHEELAHGGSRHSDELLEEAVRVPGSLAVIDSAPARRVAALGTTLAAVAERYRAGDSIEELLWELWQRTHLAARWGELAAGTGIVADEANRHLDGAVALFTAARRSVEREPDRPADLFLDEFFGVEVPEDTLSPRSRSDSVLVTTPTGAVGAECAVVVVAGLQESVWPNLRLRGSLLHAQRLSALADAGGAGADGAGSPRDAPLGSGAGADAGGSGGSRAGSDGDRIGEQTRADVLSDELRMFALAVSRSSELTVLSCVSNEDEQPSPFFGLAPDADPVPPVRHPLSLRGLTGHLRRRVTEEGDARAAAALARLATERVPGADPAEWYGLLPSSTEEPVIDPDDEEAVVRVSPSRIQAFEDSPLMWFVDQVAGGAPSIAAGIGTIVHAVMEQASADPDRDPSPEELQEAADERWRELRFEAPWIEQRERRALETKLRGLSDYLREFRRAENSGSKQLVGAEAVFTFRQGRALVSGSIDRVERDADGSLRVIDLKTGKYPVSEGDMPAHAQMAAYQVALIRDSVEGIEPGDVLGGAQLLYVSKGTRGSTFTLRTQHPLDDEGLAEIERRIETVAEGMAGAVFRGVADPGERDNQSRYEYRIQLIKAVSE
ncbi:MAG: ATP-dependent helicase [Herbiconiux sp.]|nr:MAG: ATP-dependent helicase [Herbiconiux sp.]